MQKGIDYKKTIKSTDLVKESVVRKTVIDIFHVLVMQLDNFLDKSLMRKTRLDTSLSYSYPKLRLCELSKVFTCSGPPRFFACTINKSY